MQVYGYSRKLLNKRLKDAKIYEKELRRVEKKILDVDSLSSEFDELLKQKDLLQVKIEQCLQRYGDEIISKADKNTYNCPKIKLRLHND